jgi:serine/threonine protein kinase
LKQQKSNLFHVCSSIIAGILDPDPWKRWTAFQVASHPFFTGATMQENIDPSKIKDDNHANRLFNMYWEPPSDPTIYRRKLLNVQKTREKQQAARRGFNRGHGHSRSRSVSPSSQDGLPNVRNTFAKSNNQGDDTHFATSNSDEATNQVATRLIRQGSYQGSFNKSPSMNQFAGNQGIRLLGYSSGAHPGFSGPQSFSESGNYVCLPGSFNEVDFALALHRPGVVPMGDSVTTATASTTSMSSGNQSTNQSSQVGSYGSHQVLHYSNQQRHFTAGGVPWTSRSFNEGDQAPIDSAAIPTLIDSRLQQVLCSSSHECRIGIGPPVELKAQVEISADTPMELKSENTLKRPASATSIKTTTQPPSETIQPTIEDNSASATNPSAVTNHVQPNQNLGVYDNPQVYQQQLVAMQQQFQQQQLLLQQQQAALALQQEQLRAYYSNISNAAGINAQQFGIPGTPAAAINAQQFGIPGAPATPASNISNTPGINTQQFGIAGAPTTSAASINAQQFGIPGGQAATSTTINAQQFSMPGTSAAAISAQQCGLSGNTKGPVQSTGLNPHQFGLAGIAAQVQGSRYYAVPTADGTHMIAPSNQGVAMPMPSQVLGIAPIPGILPGQLQGLPAGPAQIQGMTPSGLPSVGVPPGIAVAGMPVIQGMHAGGIIPPAGNVSGVDPAGIATIHTINNNTSPAPTGLYPNINQQQHHRQP